MLESEARTRWCPMARTYGTAGSVNRGSCITNCMCLGSNCMMFVITVEGGSTMVGYGDNVSHETEGYCGLIRTNL